MVSRFTELVVDAHDPRKLAEWWCEVLGYRIVDSDGDVVEIGSGSTPTIVFVPVPEEKTVKNRVHIDLSPVDRSQEDEVERLLAMGARHVDIGQGEQRWVVLADPEGNEFCVLRTRVPS